MNKVYDNIIIGSGITGLTIARQLLSKNIDYLILDQNSSLGGKISTISSDGYNLDNGFQILLKDYPKLNLFPEINQINYKTFKSGFAIKKEKKIFKVLNPIKNTTAFFYNNTFPGFTIKDKYLLIKLFILSNKYENLDIDVITFLKNFGFSKIFINDFFISFFQGVFLDKKLNVPIRYFLFIYKLFALSDVCIPKNGINEIMKEISKKLDLKKIKQKTKVNKISNNYLTTNNGETLYFKKLFCTDPSLENIIDTVINKSLFKNIKYNATKCFYFKVRIKNVVDTLIYLNPESKIITNMSFNKLKDNEFILSASTLLLDTNKDTIENEILSYFIDMEEISFIKQVEVLSALPSNQEFFNYKNKSFYQYTNDIYFAGDYLSEPSLNGSIQSGINVVRSLY